MLSAQMSQLVWVGVTVLHVSYRLKWLVMVGVILLVRAKTLETT